MEQQYMRNGRWMNLAQAQAYDKEKRAVKEKEKEVVEIDDIDNLKAECDKLGIKYHWNSGAEKLTELLKNSK